MVEYWGNCATVFGGLASFGGTWFFYRNAATELRDEAKKLRQQSNAIFGAVLNPEAQREGVYDKDGNLIGVIVGVEGHT